MLPWEKYQSSQQPQPSIAPQSKPWEKYSGLSPSTNQQESGFIPTLEDLKSMAPKPQEIPSLVGSMAGQFAKRTPVGMLYAGLGAGGGEAYSQLGQRAGVIPGEPPKTSLDAATQIGKKALIASLGEGIFRTVVSPAVSWAGSKIFPGANVATKAAVAAAESEGIKPLPSMISEGKAIPGLERAMEYSPFGGQITKARMKVVEDFGNYAKRVGDSISPGRNDEITGSLVKEATKGYYDTFNNVKQKLYESVLPQIKDNPVELTNTITALEDIAKRNSGPARQGGSKFFTDLLEKLKPKEGISTILKSSEPGEVSNFANLKQLGTDVYSRAKFFDPSNPGLQGDMKKLAGAIMADKDNAIMKYGDAGIKTALQKANEYNAIGKSILSSKIYKAMVASPQGNEFKIAFNANDPTAYETVKEIVGKEEMGGMARQWFNNILKKSTKNEVISPQLILNNLDRQEKLLPKIIEDFPQAGEQINKLRQISTQLVKNTDVMKGSQTAPLASLYAILADIGGSIPLMFSHPVAGAVTFGAGTGALAASKAGSSLATSDFSRNFLTKGYPAIQKGVEKTLGAISNPSILHGLSRKTEKKSLSEGLKK